MRVPLWLGAHSECWGHIAATPSEPEASRPRAFCRLGCLGCACNEVDQRARRRGAAGNLSALDCFGFRERAWRKEAAPRKISRPSLPALVLAVEGYALAIYAQLEYLLIDDAEWKVRALYQRKQFPKLLFIDMPKY